MTFDPELKKAVLKYDTLNDGFRTYLAAVGKERVTCSDHVYMAQRLHNQVNRILPSRWNREQVIEGDTLVGVIVPMPILDEAFTGCRGCDFTEILSQLNLRKIKKEMSTEKAFQDRQKKARTKKEKLTRGKVKDRRTLEMLIGVKNLR